MLLPSAGSGVTDEIARALFVRLPASPPGRTATVTVAQVPTVHCGTEVKEQSSRALVPPVGVTEQLPPVVLPGASETETTPAPVGPD
ncbi:MAG: hypothetical protein WAT35_00785, partial [Tabrizicola sp.]|uniref:hypothetical protein n=1 Tax=Tabrizicola sp. TaxID=2005166 RepID=UPI003BAE6DCA